MCEGLFSGASLLLLELDDENSQGIGFAQALVSLLSTVNQLRDTNEHSCMRFGANHVLRVEMYPALATDVAWSRPVLEHVRAHVADPEAIVWNPHCGLNCQLV